MSTCCADQGFDKLMSPKYNETCNNKADEDYCVQIISKMPLSFPGVDLRRVIIASRIDLER
jgi:hypothetical protein